MSAVMSGYDHSDRVSDEMKDDLQQLQRQRQEKFLKKGLVGRYGRLKYQTVRSMGAGAVLARYWMP